MSTLTQIDAVNAVVEAWTIRGSDNFIQHVVDMAPGATFKLQVSDPWNAVQVSFGLSTNTSGFRLLSYVGGTSYIRTVSSPAQQGITRSGNVYTWNNTSTENVTIYIITMRGSAKEV